MTDAGQEFAEKTDYLPSSALARLRLSSGFHATRVAFAPLSFAAATASATIQDYACSVEEILWPSRLATAPKALVARCDPPPGHRAEDTLPGRGQFPPSAGEAGLVQAAHRTALLLLLHAK